MRATQTDAARVFKMKLFRSVINFLRGGTPGFFPLEAAILEEAARQLGEERASGLRHRIARINFVQRHDGGREVNTYAMKNGKPTSDEADRIIFQDDEKELARFSFSMPEYGKYKGVIWLVRGRFFSLEFDKSTEHILDDRPGDLQLILCI